jgi:hypothetical protein
MRPICHRWNTAVKDIFLALCMFDQCDMYEHLVGCPGFGVFATKDFSNGEFLLEYSGQLLIQW